MIDPSTSSPSPRILLEFVSANPYSPLTLAHARGGAVGDTLARLLTHAGAQVEREFYVNDASNERQMRVFARSVFARYRQHFGREDPLPDDGFPGDYVADVAGAIADTAGDKFIALSPAEAIPLLQPLALSAMKAEQETTLQRFGVRFDHWFYESSLHESGAVEDTLRTLTQNGSAETHGTEGALWLRSRKFGDEYDHPLRRTGGLPSYLAGDLAYHQHKKERGYDRLINVWDHDHGGYVARTRAGLAALGKADHIPLNIVVCDTVRYLKEGVEMKGSRHFGNILTLEEVLDTIGREAARFFLVSTPCEVPLDLDLDNLRPESAVNPLFRIQSAQARCTETLAQVTQNNASASPSETTAALSAALESYPGRVLLATETLAPHHVALGAAEVATAYLECSMPGKELTERTAKSLSGALSLLGVTE